MTTSASAWPTSGYGYEGGVPLTSVHQDCIWCKMLPPKYNKTN